MKYTRIFIAQQPLNKAFLQSERHFYDTDVVGNVPAVDMIVLDKNGEVQFFWSDSTLEKMKEDGRKLLKRETATDTIKDAQKAIQEYWKNAHYLLEAIKQKKEREEIAGIYDAYAKALRRVYAHLLANHEYVTLALDIQVKQRVQQMFGDDADKIYMILTTPTKPDLLFLELKEWKKVLKNPTMENILKHARKYPVLFPNTFSHEEVLEWAYKRIKEKSLPSINKQLQESEKKRKELEKKQKGLLKVFKEDSAWYIREAALTRFLLKACWNGESYYMLSFYEWLAKLATCSVRDIYLFYTREEVQKLLHGNVPLPENELEKRKRYCLLHCSENKIKIYSGDMALEIKKKLLDPSLPKQDLQSFTGSTACLGKVAGIAKIVKVDSPKDISIIAQALTKEHILVTGMTNPSMMVLIEKSCGIITDEGGASCHAAIVSREFNIPCLVGCKIATHVLKDGDYVFLDATNRIVKKITKEEYEAWKEKVTTF